MGDIERYDGRMAGQEVVQFDGPMEGQGEPMTQMIGGILRRWYIIVATFIIVCGAGVPAVWFLMKEKYETKGAIRVSPIVSRILFNDSDSERPMPNYENFMNSEAGRMAGNTVLNRVADELADKNLEFFKDAVDPIMALREAVNEGDIEIASQRRSEYITLKMVNENPREAEQIIDSFIRSYMNIMRAEEDTGSDNTLSILDEQKRTLESRIEEQGKEINRLLDEYGTGKLDAKQESLQQLVMRLQQDKITVTVQRISLEAKVEMLENKEDRAPSEIEKLERQNAFVNSNPKVQTLTADIRQYENKIIVDRQTMTESNPVLRGEIEILANLKEELATKRKELASEFAAKYDAELEKSKNYALAQAKAELAQAIEHENKLALELKKYEDDTVTMGRKQLNIDDKQAELARTREMYDTVCNRINQIEMEQKRPARISIAEMASSAPAKGKRKKLAAATVFGGGALGVFFAFLLAKTDKRLRDTRDVVKRVGVRIIGTTTSPRHIDRKMIARQLSDDYQTIRANLGLLNGHANSRVLVVTSPGVRDGKTTFAVNLALSFAQSGEKVLLIDGDLRKPDVAETLNLPKGVRGLQDMLFGRSLEESVYKLNDNGLHVLAADYRNSADALDLLGQVRTAECMRNIGDGYDHVIIDTPPVLAFADALVWAKMADAVILTSFAEHTSRPDLREAIDHLEQIGAYVLGTVLNNVKVTNSYHRYGYGYAGGYGDEGQRKRRSKRQKRDRMLLLGSSRVDEETSS